MASSDANPSNTIFLDQKISQVKKLIKKAVTDSEEGIDYDLTHRPGTSNLLEIFCRLGPLQNSAHQGRILSLQPISEQPHILDGIKCLKKVEFKKELSNRLVYEVEQIQEYKSKYSDEFVLEFLDKNAASINSKFDVQIDQIRKNFGLVF